MKLPLLLLLLLLFVQDVRYDKFTDRLIVTTKDVEVYRKRGGLLIYNPARVAVRSFRVTSGDSHQYGLFFQVDSYDWQFTSHCVVRVIADKRYEFPCTTRDAKAFSLGRSVYVSEYLAILLSPAEFKAIFESESIEMQTGAYEFKLKPKHVKELRKATLGTKENPAG